jgi:putative tricarboxylic transport membrane protein
MNKDLITGICAVIFGGVYAAQALQLPKATIGNPLAPVYFPLGLGILMVAIGLVQIAAAIREKQEHKTKAKDEGYAILILGTALLGVLYALIFEHVGFIISTLFFLGGILFLVNGPKAWKMNTSVTVIFTLSIWYVFEQVLSISLP